METGRKWSDSMRESHSKYQCKFENFTSFPIESLKERLNLINFLRHDHQRQVTIHIVSERSITRTITAHKSKDHHQNTNHRYKICYSLFWLSELFKSVSLSISLWLCLCFDLFCCGYFCNASGLLYKEDVCNKNLFERKRNKRRAWNGNEIEEETCDTFTTQTLEHTERTAINRDDDDDKKNGLKLDQNDQTVEHNERKFATIHSNWLEWLRLLMVFFSLSLCFFFMSHELWIKSIVTPHKNA